jgi:hypothetical protein
VRSGLYKLSDVVENAHYLGIDNERLADAAERDPGIAEFCRFYIERRAQEMAAAGMMRVNVRSWRMISRRG